MKQPIALLQAGRGLGALVVLVAHVTIFAQEKLERIFLGGSWRPAVIVIDFFFVLSGFIMLHTNRASVGIPGEGWRYVLRRFVRIYPLLIALTLLKVTYLVAHGAGIPIHKKDAWYIVSSTLLLPREDLPFIDVSWSLPYEVLCYLLFVFAILFGRRTWIWAAAHSLGCLWINLAWSPELPIWIRFLFSPYVLEFYAGCGIAWLCTFRFLTPKVGAACLITGMTMLSIGIPNYRAIGDYLQHLNQLYWGLAFEFLVLGAVVLETRASIHTPRWLCFLGDASYSIYLSHSSVVVAGGLLIKRRLVDMDPHLTSLLMLLACVALATGIACYHWLEKPMLNWLQKRLTRRRPPVCQPATNLQPA